ncbi:MAG: hypothetical protein RL143_1160 [Pseudomonadota bacterium]
MPKLRPLLVGVAVLLPLLLLIYLLQDYLDAYLQRDAQVMACDINMESCQLDLIEGQRLSLTMNPAPAASLTPLTFTLSVIGEQPQGVWLDLQGTEEYMGINQTVFNYSDTGWIGKTELAVCTTGRMTWKGRLMITLKSGETHPVDFFFEAE